MQLGDTVENAIWLDGRETKEQRKAYEKAVEVAIEQECSQNGFMCGKVIFHVKHPYDERVPPVPEHITGTQPRLLVAESDVIGLAIEEVQSSFISDIEPRDLLKLREITRRAAVARGHFLNDHEVDDIIETLGPEAAMDALRRSMN